MIISDKVLFTAIEAAEAEHSCWRVTQFPNGSCVVTDQMRPIDINAKNDTPTYKRIDLADLEQAKKFIQLQSWEAGLKAAFSQHKRESKIVGIR